MTITFVSAGTASTGNNASVTPGAPAGVAVGDLVLILATIRNFAVGAPATPTGWAIVKASTGVKVFGRFWQTGDAMPLVTFTGGVANADTLVQACAFRNVSPDAITNPTTASQSNASAQNVAYPALDVPGASQLVIIAAGKADDYSSVTVPATFTLIGNTSTTTGDDASQMWFYRIETTEADISAASITVTGGASAISASMTLAFHPAAVFTVAEQTDYPPRALLTLTGLVIGDAVELYRVVGGERTAVRAGSDDAVSDTSFVRVDGEIPFGVPVHYVAVVNGTAEYTSSAVTYTLPGGKVVVSDAINGTAAEVVILSWPEKAYDSDASVFRTGTRTVVVSTGPGQFQGTIELFVEATSSVDNLSDLLSTATAGIIHIRQPGGYDGVDSYISILSHTIRRFSQDGSDERRVFVLNVAEVDGWATTLEASGYTLQDVADVYTGLTLQDLSNDFATLLLLAQGEFLT